MSVALDLMFADVGGRTRLTRRRHRWPLLVGRVFPDSADPKLGSVTVQNAAGTLIPGDVVAQHIAVVDGGSAWVRGQGATTVSGIPGGAVAAERTDLRVGAASRLVFDPAPRILTPYARYLQRTRVCVDPGGQAVLVDAVVLHPDLDAEVFGGYDSEVRIESSDQVLLALDAQLLESFPRTCRAPTAFATVYVLGCGAVGDMESLSVLGGDRRVYVATTELPNAAGWAVRIAAWDGGTLRKVVSRALDSVDLSSERCRCRPSSPAVTSQE